VLGGVVRFMNAWNGLLSSEEASKLAQD
jgi:hypothetical protein